LVPVSEVLPSPENQELYGAIDHINDPELPALVRSIRRLGLEEPLILTRDKYILSGHRRFAAVEELGWDAVPARFAAVKRADVSDYHRLLAQYNPQRVKTVATTLAEALLEKDSDDSSEALGEFRARRAEVSVEFEEVDGCKDDPEIGPRKQEFLKAVRAVVNRMNSYWPLTVRQVHYQLLNDPPLTQTTKDRNERWRYRNNLACYSKLSKLLVAARYAGHIPFEAVQDATRPSLTWKTFDGVNAFVREQVEGFLRGYYVDRQTGQPHQVEVVLEKKTLLNVCEGVCARLHVPLTALGGYGGPSVWREIERRYRRACDAAGKASVGTRKLILVFLSDHDPEGFDLVDDAVRSLRDRHHLPVEVVRAAITVDQVKTFGAHPNPAKEGSSRLAEYVRRTGTKDTWECESIPPDELSRTLHEALISVMDVDQLNACQEREIAERNQIASIRGRLANEIRRLVQEGEG